MTQVQLAEWREGIHEDMFINVISASVKRDRKGYDGMGTAYYAFKTGDEAAELEAAKEKFLEDARGTPWENFYEAEFEAASGRKIKIRGKAK